MNPVTIDQTLTVRIRDARAAAGLSLREAVDGTEYGAAYLCRVEHGSRRPSLRFLRSLAPKLGVTPRWLETGSDDVEVVLDRDTAEALLSTLELVADRDEDGEISAAIAAFESALGIAEAAA